MYPLLEIKDLTISFPGENKLRHAVKNISLQVNQGEVLAIVGESGSGKSVTALSVLKLLPASAQIHTGKIFFSENGQQRVELSALEIKRLSGFRGGKIAMIFQEPMTSLNPVFTCGKQVTETITLHKKCSPEEARRQTTAWFRKVKLPDPEAIFHRYPHQLSGGQKQRVMIAMALSSNPSLLICDEPTTALDVTVQKDILNLLKDLQQEENIGVIFITHDLGLVNELANRAAVMYQGEIIEQNTTKEIFSNPQHPYTKSLLACRPVLHPKGERLPVVSDFLEGKNTTFLKQTGNIKPPGDTALISMENLSVWFPGKKNFWGSPVSFIKAVDGVSFEVRERETLGLVGESGCGKTTLGRTLLRLIEPTSGRIRYKGTDLTAKKSNELKPLRKDIQIVFQDPYSSLNPRIRIGEAITEPMEVHGLYKNNRQRKDKAAELLQKVNLETSHLGRYPHEFSGGQRQRIVIARALALNPSFLVCDESVSALDVSVQAQVLNLLNDLKSEFDFTILFISHDLSVVRYLSDRILVMHEGRIIESGNADQIYFQPRHPYTQKLIASIPGR